MYMPIIGVFSLIAGIAWSGAAIVEFLSWCGVSGMPRMASWMPWTAYLICGAARIEDGLCKMGRGRS